MLKRFHTAEQGNVAIVFALALLPMTAFAGAALDYSRAGSLRGTSCRLQQTPPLSERRSRRMSARTSSASRSPRLCSRQTRSLGHRRRPPWSAERWS